jgi:hypothetical protein
MVKGSFKHVSIFQSLSFKITALVALFLSSVIIILALSIGNEAGNFVVQVESGNVTKSLAITETLEDDLTYKDRIVTSGIKNISDNAPHLFMPNGISDVKEMTESSGVNLSYPDLYVYTFYVVNTCDQDINLEFNMKITSVHNNLDKAIRVMSYNETEESLNVYQARDEIEKEYIYYEYQPQLFVDDKTVYKQNYTLKSNEEDNNYIKYSVLIWIEGEDPECNEKIYLSAIKFQLDINVL